MPDIGHNSPEVAAYLAADLFAGSGQTATAQVRTLACLGTPIRITLSVDGNLRSAVSAMTVLDSQEIFNRWTMRRDLASMGTNDGATPLAFQKWHNFKEAFAPELIHEAISNAPSPVASCLDPFGGSGTTALTCQMLGVRSTTVEVNPYLADVIRAKVQGYESDLLVARLREVRRQSRRLLPTTLPNASNLPPTFIEPGVDGRWIFDAPVASALTAILKSIDNVTVDNEPIRRFFRVVLGGMLTEVSNVIISGKGRRYRRNWQDRKSTSEDVLTMFASRAESAIGDVIAYGDRPDVGAIVVEGDTRAQRFDREFDLSVFSPPYPNSFDYTDVYNVQLWMLGYLSNSSENMALRRETLSSHVQVSRVFDPPPTGSQTLTVALADLEREREDLWSKHLPAMVGAYFHDLLGVTENVISSLKYGAECWMVVGDSRYGNTHVPVAKVVSELLTVRGHAVVSAEPIRHMKTSAQQGFKSDLAESLLKVRSEQHPRGMA